MQAVREYTPPIQTEDLFMSMGITDFPTLKIVDELLELAKEHQKRVDEYLKRK